MQKKKQTFVAVVCIIILAIIAGCYSTYYYWIDRGDQVLFSSTGQWGLGKTPLYSMASRSGGKLLIGTNYSFFFVRDIHADLAAEKKFHGTSGGGAPGAGGAPGRPPAGGPPANSTAAPHGPAAGAPGGHAGP